MVHTFIAYNANIVRYVIISSTVSDLFLKTSPVVITSLPSRLDVSNTPPFCDVVFCVKYASVGLYLYKDTINTRTIYSDSFGSRRPALSYPCPNE